jgi:sugar/nucleoside kinase (ribokinase family)
LNLCGYNLGASLRMGAADFPEEEALAGARLLHIEGYTLYRPELAKAAMKASKSRGAMVSLDLASFEVVRNCRAQLLEILESGVVDLLFANEDEAEELMNIDDHNKHNRHAAAAAAAADAAPAGAEEVEDVEGGDQFTRWGCTYSC